MLLVEYFLTQEEKEINPKLDTISDKTEYPKTLYFHGWCGLTRRNDNKFASFASDLCVIDWRAKSIFNPMFPQRWALKNQGKKSAKLINNSDITFSNISAHSLGCQEALYTLASLDPEKLKNIKNITFLDPVFLKVKSPFPMTKKDLIFITSALCLLRQSNNFINYNFIFHIAIMLIILHKLITIKATPEKGGAIDQSIRCLKYIKQNCSDDLDIKIIKSSIFGSMPCFFGDNANRFFNTVKGIEGVQVFETHYCRNPFNTQAIKEEHQDERPLFNPRVKAYM